MRKLLVILPIMLLLFNSKVIAEEIPEEELLISTENHEDDFNGYKTVDGDELGTFIVESRHSKYNSAQLNFVCEIPDGFNLGVVLEVENETEGVKFRLTSTSSNEYISRMYVPPGKYRVLSCYVSGDTTMKYPMLMPGDFTIRDSESYTVSSSLINYEDIKKEAEDRLSNKNDDPVPSYINSNNSFGEREAEKIPHWRTVIHKGEGNAPITITGLCKYKSDLVIKITASGGDREGEYTYSTDGGENWSDINVIKTASDQIILLTDGSLRETGLKVRFDSMGEYIKYDEYLLSCPIEYKIEEIGNVGKGQIELSSDDIVYNDSYKFIMKVTKTGSLGEGAFVYSLDNGLSWSKETLIPKSGKFDIPKTILKVSFFDGNGGFMVSDTYKSEIKGDMSKRDYTPYLFGFIVIVCIGLYMLIGHYLKMKDNPESYRLHTYEPVIVNRKKRKGK